MHNPYKPKSSVNPQREHGHRQIANDLFRAIIAAKLSGGEYQVLLSLIDKTWGFNEPSDNISYSQMVKATRLSRRAVISALQRLERKRIVVVNRKVVNGSLPINEYMLNKHYDTWESKLVNGNSLQLVNGASPTKESIKEKEDILPPYGEIISDLNEKTGKNFRHQSAATRRLINGRWAEGFRLEDFIKVHAVKAEQWKKDPKMVKYLRPSTLYQSGKFESYLNETPVSAPTIVSSPPPGEGVRTPRQVAEDEFAGRISPRYVNAIMAAKARGVRPPTFEAFYEEQVTTREGRSMFESLCAKASGHVFNEAERNRHKEYAIRETAKERGPNEGGGDGKDRSTGSGA